jgi:hypothetical protein
MPTRTRLARFARCVVVSAVAGSPLPFLFAADAAPKADGGAARAAVGASAVAGAADEGFVSLFNGKDLAGWVVTTCTAKAENGTLVLADGNGWVRTEKQYGDFVLDLEWKNLKAEKFDSGVYFRSEKLKPGKRFPDKYQINLLQGEEGSLVTNKQVKVVGEGKVKGLAKAGEWNRLRLTCVGGKAELEVNGKPAWKVDGIVPAVGFIGLQCEVTGGGPFEFQNLKVKPLTPPVEAKDDE